MTISKSVRVIEIVTRVPCICAYLKTVALIWSSMVGLLVHN
jgi:hypothetical protein